MEILLLINPVAGRQIMAQEEKKVLAVFEDAGHDATVVYTSLEISVKEQLAKYISDSTDMLVCAGGDGTLNKVVCAVIELGLQILLGYLPAGSTNDFAVSLGLPKRPAAAVSLALSGEPRSLDAGKFGNGPYFVYVASFGAFTQASYTTTQSLKNTIGHMAYIVEGMKELPNLKEYHVKVQTEYESFEGDYVFGAVTNTSSIAGVIRLPGDQVKFDDGLMELALVKMPKNIGDFHRIVMSLLSGSYDPAVITFRHVKWAEFSSDSDIPWSLDGEYASGGREVKIEVLPKAFSLMLESQE